MTIISLRTFNSPKYPYEEGILLSMKIISLRIFDSPKHPYEVGIYMAIDLIKINNPIMWQSKRYHANLKYLHIH